MARKKCETICHTPFDQVGTYPAEIDQATELIRHTKFDRVVNIIIVVRDCYAFVRLLEYLLLFIYL